MSFHETLYRSNKDGSIQVWKVETVGAWLYTTSGRLDGVLRKSPGVEYEATNVGRANERSARMVAMEAAASMARKQMDKGFRKTVAAARALRPLLPMLAQTYAGLDSWPVSVQRKYDGLRCLAVADGSGVRLLSRNGKEFKLEHLTEAIERVRDWFAQGRVVLDGELYCHGMTLQEIMSAVKREQEATEKIEYMVYDVPEVGNESAAWTVRHGWLYDVYMGLGEDDPVKVAPTVMCDSEKELVRMTSRFISEGYEGAMVRLEDGEYEWNHRSSGLLKVKRFKDDEFVIVDVVSGSGKNDGLATFVCVTDKGTEFRVMPEGTEETRRTYLIMRKRLLGRKLTVRYARMTADGVPFHPVGVAVRDDLPNALPSKR